MRLWTLRNGWESGLARVYPGLAFDRGVDRSSDGWVFAIPVSGLPRSATDQ